jgi:hypothetical protein
MTARIIWIFRNNEHSAVAPRSALSAGAAHAARPVVLPAHGRAALPVSPSARPSPPARGNLAPPRFGDGLFIYDATAERWIVNPSRMTRDAGAAADLRYSDENTQSLGLPTPPGDRPPLQISGRLLRECGEALAFTFGLTVFGLIAAAFLVLA